MALTDAASAIEPRPTWRRDGVLLLALVLFSLFIRSYHLGQVERHFDEIYYPDGAASYLVYGVHDRAYPDAYPFDKDRNHVHPPAGKLMMAMFMELWWGVERYVLHSSPESPVSWRIGSVVLGVAVVLMTWRLALSMFRSRFTAALAALLVAIDPLHIVQSRMGMIDMYEAFWIMAGLICTWRFIQAPPRDMKWAWWASVVFGWGVATKWSTLFAMVGALVAVYVLKPVPEVESRRPWLIRLLSTGRVALVGLSITILIYAASYIPLWRADHYDTQHTWADIKFYHTQMWNFRYDPNQFRHQYKSEWWQWPTCERPIWYVYREEADDDDSLMIPWAKQGWFSRIFCAARPTDNLWCQCQIAIGSPLTWLFFLGCMPLLLHVTVRSAVPGPVSDRSSNARALAFCTLAYVPQVVMWSINQGFIYYMLPVVPLMCLAISSILAGWRQSRVGTVLMAMFLVAVGIWAVAFYPMLIGDAVPKPYFERFMLLRSWI